MNTGLTPASQIPARVLPAPADALLIVDMQNSFLPGGSLAVAGGDQIIPAINQTAKKFGNVIITQDWHPANHISFASQHAGRQPYESVELPYGSQVLWPDHCVQGTQGAEISSKIDCSHVQLILRKGFHRRIDSYSAFLEADRRTATGLGGYLKERGIGTIFLCGLATDYCVAWTALDARAIGLKVWVIEDATQGIDLNGSLAAAWSEMAKAGVRRIRSAEIGPQ